TNVIDRVVAGEEWRCKNMFGYELRTTVPVDNAFRQFQHDLNAYFGRHFHLRASIEHTARHKYAVLRVSEDRQTAESLLATSSTIRKARNTDEVWAYDNYPIGHLRRHIALALGHVPKLRLTIDRVVDSTGIKDDFLASFEFPKHVRTSGEIEAIQQVIKPYGLYLTIEEKDVPVLVVRQFGNTDNESTSSN